MESVVPVIIVNWNGRGLLPECLDALCAQTWERLRIILVDNGSQDGSAEFVRRNYPDIRVFSLPRNVGFAAANNVALRTVRTPYVALLNNDAIAAPGWLEALVRELELNREAGAAASKMLFYDTPDIIDRAGDSYTVAGAGLLRGRGRPSESLKAKEFVFGACAGAALYRVEMLREIGLFDEDFFLIYEDVDLSFRAQLTGYKCVYVPEAEIFHRAGSSIGRDSPISVYYGHRNLEWVYWKNMPSSLILKSLLLHLNYDFLSFLYFSAAGLGAPFLRAKRDALRGLPAVLKKRRLVQKKRRVPDECIWRLLDKERSFSRLGMRRKHIPKEPPKA